MLNEENNEERLSDVILDAIITLLQHLSKARPLPVGLRHKLHHWMRVIRPKTGDRLELGGKLHNYAYFIVEGFIYVTYIDAETKQVRIKCFYAKDEIAALQNFIDELAGGFTLVAGCDTVLARISLEAMHNIYETWPDMIGFAKSVVGYFDGQKDRLKDLLTEYGAKISVPHFFELYECLKDGKKVRMRKEIAGYLGVSTRTLRRYTPKEKKEGSSLP